MWYRASSFESIIVFSFQPPRFFILNYNRSSYCNIKHFSTGKQARKPIKERENPLCLYCVDNKVNQGDGLIPISHILTISVFLHLSSFRIYRIYLTKQFFVTTKMYLPKRLYILCNSILVFCHSLIALHKKGEQ